jgi:exonuclease SbcD
MIRPLCNGRGVRIIHTSDWHLGHSLRSEVTREYEHAAFLQWLLEACAREAADALVITGDVFDSATPPASAERMWFEFLAAARKACPAMDIVAIAGNHDSPARLGAASSVLRELGVHVVGGLPRRDGAIDFDRVLIPIARGAGLVAAVPFLRPIDVLDLEDPLAAIYGEVIAEARVRRTEHQALIVTGHLYMAGADAQFLSERRVAVGGQESAPLRLFPEDIAYVALGHIHRAQRVGRETIRYAGAPIALALDEAAYKHQVMVIDFADGIVIDMRPLIVPRVVEVMRVSGSFVEVLAELSGLPYFSQAELAADPARPFLQVTVVLDKPEPRLRSAIELVLDGKRPRLVYLHAEQTGDRAALGDRISARLSELDPREVFVRLWARDHAEPPSEAVLAAFEELLAEVRGDREDLAS